MARWHALALLTILATATTTVQVVDAKQTPLAGVQVATQCPADGPLSCSSDADAANNESGSCCLESPGGLLLQTQFWDTNPATGPSDSWTIHGLWPDNCDLTFKENCDRQRVYTNIAGLLEDQGAQDTLDFMKTYWVDIHGKDETFWEHEWSTHGTCYSTLAPSCLPEGSPRGAEAVAFFQIVVNLFQTLPTYTWLAKHGIVPSATGTHTLQSLKDALQTEAGVIPALDCQGNTLDSVSWYFNLRGSLLEASPGFVAIDAPEEGNCPNSGIRYPPKGETGDGDEGKETPSRRKRRKEKQQRSTAEHQEL
ncbi:ribonuclease T2-like protein [Mycena amicta]|nr:ribonuclease T2-like protein [Mycena amicta]